jgi:oxalate decarboxylase/phosphoglucose isomerase-like protein (cupin superfamily)
MKLPDISTLYKNIIRDSDNRGSILSIVDYNVANVSIISCNAGSIRSNHYHKKDYHFMYVLKGEINYFYKSLNDEIIHYIKVSEGDTIFTPCLEIHATHFPLNTKLIVSSGFPRDQNTYEADTVRVPFINSENVNEMLALHRNN